MLPWSREAELMADIEKSHQRFEQLGGVIGDVAAINATKARVEERLRLHSVLPVRGGQRRRSWIPGGPLRALWTNSSRGGIPSSVFCIVLMRGHEAHE